MICPYCQQETGHFAKHAWPDGCAKAVMSPPTPTPRPTLSGTIRSLQRSLDDRRQREALSENISALERVLETRRMGANLYGGTSELLRPVFRYTATTIPQPTQPTLSEGLGAWDTIQSCVAAFNAQQYDNGWSALAVQSVEYDRFDITVSYHPPVTATTFSATQSATGELYSSMADTYIHSHVQTQLEYCITQVRQAVIDTYSLCNHPNRWTCYFALQQTQEDRELLIENYLARFNLAQVVASSPAFQNRYSASTICPGALDYEEVRDIRVAYYDASSYPTYGNIPIPTNLLYSTTTVAVISSEVRILLNRVITQIRLLTNTPEAAPW